MPYQGLPILAVLVNSQTPPIKISIIIKNSDQSMSGDNDPMQLVVSQYGPQFPAN